MEALQSCYGRSKSRSPSSDSSKESSSSSARRKRRGRKRRRSASQSHSRSPSGGGRKRRSTGAQVGSEVTEAALERRRNEVLQSSFGYTNEENPFGDRQLTRPFVWRKKWKSEGVGKAEVRQLQEKDLSAKQAELREEIRKTKARREQREKEKVDMEEMQAELAREAQLEDNADWREKEEAFSWQQSVRRALLRYVEKRAVAIDVLTLLFEFDSLPDADDSVDAKYAVDRGAVARVQWPKPVQLIDALDAAELRRLQSAIDEVLQQFSTAAAITGESEEQLQARSTGWRMAKEYVNYAVQREEVYETLPKWKMEEIRSVESLLSAANAQEVDALLQKAKEMESGRDLGGVKLVDIQYWTLVSKLASVTKAKLFLRTVHSQREAMRKEQCAKMEAMEQKQMTGDGTISTMDHSVSGKLADASDALMFDAANADVYMSDSELGIEFVDKCEKRFALLLRESVSELQMEDELEDLRSAAIRKALRTAKQTPAVGSVASDLTAVATVDSSTTSRKYVKDSGRDKELFERESKRKGADDELKFNGSEVSVPESVRSTESWHHKYAPRKPRYFNRVRTGYSWNKYNQTHYDSENPPPKIVMGYKFNLFYPDLIDAGTVPRFRVFEAPLSEYATIVFQSGPPYEDIAFKIVNNEWEVNHKRGYRCCFEKGIFSLYFNFKRYRYRR